MFIAGMLMYETMDSAWFRGKLTRTCEVFAICISRVWHLFISTTRALSCLAFCLNLLKYELQYYLFHGLALHAVAVIAYSIVPEGHPSLRVFLLAMPPGFAMT